MRPPASLRRFGRVVLDSLLPPRCLGCGALTEDTGLLCPNCWNRVTFIGPPQCAACGLPFEFDLDEDALCGACARHHPAFGRARAVMAYDDGCRSLILGFKHGDRTDAAPALGRWMVRAAADLVAAADLIVPVPLHWTRLFARRYNQAALLADRMGRETDIPVAPDLLVRRRRTPSQGGLGARQRRENLRGAIAVHPAWRRRLDGNVLLVDDVLTTGATAEACARVLRRGGARRVDVLTLARVVRPAF